VKGLRYALRGGLKVVILTWDHIPSKHGVQVALGRAGLNSVDPDVGPLPMRGKLKFVNVRGLMVPLQVGLSLRSSSGIASPRSHKLQE
jgi:hypothetical protein